MRPIFVSPVFALKSVLSIVLLVGLPMFNHAHADNARTMRVYVTVDWEGVSLEQENIATMQAFRQQFPHIPMLQLLNPVYFLRDAEHAAQTAEIVRSTFLPQDTQGLHVHAWKSLVTYCGVPYQHQYSFADTDENCTQGDCGYTVSLEYAYSQADLTQLIACSSQVLTQHGFTKPTHFRAGGWQLGPKLSAALQANGFMWDSSVTDPNLLTTRWHEQSGMVAMLRQLHPTSTPLDQPYAVSTQLMEYPNNASLADYTSTKQIVHLFKQLIQAKKTVMVLGFHQETATDYLIRLEKAIPQMEAIAEEQGVKIEWVSH
jgi:hypothetical protein